MRKTYENCQTGRGLHGFALELTYEEVCSSPLRSSFRLLDIVENRAEEVNAVRRGRRLDLKW